MTECNYCHHTVVESYGAEVEMRQNREVLRTAEQSLDRPRVS